ncbi:MAG TPA: type II secretion system protein [Phycisphaerae bacterium]|nr:type II secretion system protein [Phycisphaerae bacterium]
MKRQHHAAGLTLIELLVAAVLTAILITSIAVAMHASLENYSVNQRVANGTHVARRVLNNISEKIRTAQAVDSGGGSSILRIVPPDSEGIDQIEYELVGTVLYYRETIGATTNTYILVGDTLDDVKVDTFTVTKESGLDSEGQPCTAKVIIDLGLDIKGQPINMRASASPRKNQTY